MKSKRKYKDKIILSIVTVYTIIAVCLMSDSDTEITAYVRLALSLFFVLAGTHGLIHKYNAAVTPPRGPVFDYKVSYKDDDSIHGIMGRIGNVISIILGVIVLSLVFE